VLIDPCNTGRPPRTAFVIYYMSQWSLPLAAINRLIGRDVSYVHARGLISKAWVRDLLDSVSIRLFDFLHYAAIDDLPGMEAVFVRPAPAIRSRGACVPPSRSAWQPCLLRCLSLGSRSEVFDKGAAIGSAIYASEGRGRG
jgi:hypothetical protein